MVNLGGNEKYALCPYSMVRVTLDSNLLKPSWEGMRAAIAMTSIPSMEYKHSFFHFQTRE